MHQNGPCPCSSKNCLGISAAIRRPAPLPLLMHKLSFYGFNFISRAKVALKISILQNACKIVRAGGHRNKQVRGPGVAAG